MRRARIVLLLLILAAAAGCGQKGPLYLPDGDRQEQQEQD